MKANKDKGTKILFSFLLSFSIGISFCQIPDTSFHISAPCWCGMHRYNEDTSSWRLYKIANEIGIKQYYYFALVSYGMIGKDGWSDAVGYMEFLHQKKDFLLDGSNIKDTIPEAVYNGTYDEKKKKFKNWTEYRVGGFLGELIRVGETTYEK